MKFAKWFKRIVLGLLVVVLVYYGLGGILVWKVSQREETWHDEAIARSKPATMLDWVASVRQEHPRIEVRYRHKQQLYLVKIFEGRGYVSALHRGSSDVPPIRIDSGKIDRAKWRALRDLAEQMYPVRDTLFQKYDNMNPSDVRLTIVHEDGSRALYKYHTTDYAQLPQLLRDYDALLFDAMRSWNVKPHHGYAKPLPTLSYGVETIPSLVRGLETPREELYASVVERLVEIGKPALPELIRVLREGAQTRYQPVSRYIAVIGGIGRLGDMSSEGYTLVRDVVESRASLSEIDEFKVKAQEVVDRFEIDAYLAKRWIVSPEVEAWFIRRPLTPQQEADALGDFRLRYGDKKTRNTAIDAMVEIGPGILPALLQQLRRDRVERNMINGGLLEALGALAGHEGYYYAIKNDFARASDCVLGLSKLGADGVPGLMALLESGERSARWRAAEALSRPESADYIDEFSAQLKRKLSLYRDTTPGAVREMHKDGAIRLINVIRAHGAPDDISLQAVVAAATDSAQDERTQIVALEALGRLGSRAASTVPQLEAVAGYATRKVHETLKETLAMLAKD